MLSAIFVVGLIRVVDDVVGHLLFSVWRSLSNVVKGNKKKDSEKKCQVILYWCCMFPKPGFRYKTFFLVMRILRSFKSCTLRDGLYNKDTPKELKMSNLPLQKIKRWIADMNEISDSKLSKEIWQYKDIGQRSIGRV